MTNPYTPPSGEEPEPENSSTPEFSTGNNDSAFAELLSSPNGCGCASVIGALVVAVVQWTMGYASSGNSNPVFRTRQEKLAFWWQRCLNLGYC